MQCAAPPKDQICLYICWQRSNFLLLDLRSKLLWNSTRSISTIPFPRTLPDSIMKAYSSNALPNSPKVQEGYLRVEKLLTILKFVLILFVPLLTIDSAFLLDLKTNNPMNPTYCQTAFLCTQQRNMFNKGLQNFHAK